LPKQGLRFRTPKKNCEICGFKRRERSAGGLQKEFDGQGAVHMGHGDLHAGGAQRRPADSDARWDEGAAGAFDFPIFVWGGGRW
jgi:hypothetical protein